MEGKKMRGKRIVSILLCLTLVVVALGFQGFTRRSGNEVSTVHAASQLDGVVNNVSRSGLRQRPDKRYLVDETVLSTATLDDYFTDCTVIVTMTRQASLSLREHGVSDFPEVGFVEVRNLSYAVESNVREQFYGRQVEERSSLSDVHYGLVREDIDVENFRQIISLTLQEPGKENVLQAIRTLEQRDDVFAAGPNWIVKPGSLNSMRTQAAVSRVSLPQAWDNIEAGTSAVTVGIMDTGVDGTHPDLVGRLHPANSNMHGDFTGSGISPLIDDGFAHWWNGHGTHVAGIVGPMTSLNVRLASLRVFCTVTGNSSFDSVLAAVNHAVARNIDILNFSANGFPYDATLNQRIRDFNRPFILSAGNDNVNIAPTSNHIARANISNLIVVGATTLVSDGERRAISPDFGWSQGFGTNWGFETVDVFAPGTAILSTVPTSVDPSGYMSWSGTSMAAPMVAGVAALIMSHQPGISGANIRQAIVRGVDTDIPILRFASISGGRLNAYRALRFAWRQPIYTSNNTIVGGGNYGQIETSGSLPLRPGWGAFDGWMGDVRSANVAGCQWTKQARSGWIELRLGYVITVHSIEFRNRYSTSNGRTRNARFWTGHPDDFGQPLGPAFEARNTNGGSTIIQVGGIRTSTIHLEIRSSWTPTGITGIGQTPYIGANAIIINATQETRTVRFMNANRAHAIPTVDVGTFVPVPPNPSRLDYVFQGWSLDGVNVIDLQTHPINYNTAFHAVFVSAGWVATWTGNHIVKGRMQRSGWVDLRTLSNQPLTGMEIRITYQFAPFSGPFVVQQGQPFNGTMLTLTISVTEYHLIVSCSMPAMLSTTIFSITRIEIRLP